MMSEAPSRRVSVDPGDGDPLRGGGHQVDGLLQQSDGVVDLVVDDGLVKVVGVGPLQHLGFLLEPLERVILGCDGEIGMAGGLATGLQGHLWSTSIGSGINV